MENVVFASGCACVRVFITRHLFVNNLNFFFAFGNLGYGVLFSNAAATAGGISVVDMALALIALVFEIKTIT